MGLEETLITDHILGKQSDTKLANMIVRDDGDQLVFTTIDHERAVTPTGISFFIQPLLRTPPVNGPLFAPFMI